MRSPSVIAFTAMALVIMSGRADASWTKTLLSETFDTDTADTATTLATYPEFSLSGTGNTYVTGGQLRMTTTGNAGDGFRNFYVANVPVGEISIVADISKTPGGGSFNTGMVIGDYSLVFHPGFGGGAFRIEGPGGIGNQNMGFTPPAWPTMHKFEVDVSATGLFDITITDGSNPSNVYQYQFQSLTYAAGDPIGFTVAGGVGNEGVFDNILITTVVPEPATATLGLLALGGLGAVTRRRRA